MASKKKVWVALTSVSAVLLAAACIGTSVANYFSPWINSTLNCSTVKVEKADNGNVDTEYFKSNYTYDRKGEEKLIQDGKDLYRSIIEEGTSLLKNDNKALPFASTDKKVTVFGNAAPQYLPALNTKLKEAGYEINENVWSKYAAKKSTARKFVNLAEWDDTMQSATGDVAIITLGRRAGEGTDCAHPGDWSLNKADGTEFPNGDYLDLATSEVEMLTKVKALKDAGQFKKIVVVISTSNSMHGDFLKDPQYGIDAALWLGQADKDYGTEGLVNILKGKVNPSGRIVDTIYMDNLKNPVMQNFGAVDGDMSGASADYIAKVKELNYTFSDNPQGDDWDDSVVYQEGIYLGYKYAETRYEDQVLGTPNAGKFDYDEYVAYPFGYGLSYTSFEYSNFKVELKDGNYILKVDVKNTGSVAGKQSVMAYLQKPYTEYAKKNGIEQSAVNLVGFAKTSGEVAPGKTETVTIEVPEWQMRTYDANGAGTYIQDAGDYYFTVAGDSHEAVQNILEAKGYDTEGNKDLVYKKTEKFDDKKFSKNYATGVEISNLFECADLNKDVYASKTNQVTYMSRSNWEGTVPTQTFIVKYNDDMVKQAEPVTYKADPEQQKNTPMPKFGVKHGLSVVALREAPYDDPIWYDLLEQMTYEETAALVMDCWYGSRAVASVGKPQQTDQDSSMGRCNPFNANPDLVGTPFPSGDMRAATCNTTIMEDIGIIEAEQNLHSSTATTKSIGLYGFSPNIHRSPYSGRNGEYFSEDAFITGTACGLSVKGMTEHGSVCFAKHYFLNDQEDHRHGIATWANEQTLRETYLPAFEYTVTLYGGMGFMNSFNRIGMLWSGEHYGSQLGFLYNECGFKGNIVTDMFEVDHQDVIDGLLGGTTMWLHTTLNPYSYGLLTSDQYRNDPVIVTALVEAAHRMLYGSSRSAAVNGLSANTKLVEITPWWKIACYSIDGVLAVLTAASAAMLVVSIVKDKKEN